MLRSTPRLLLMLGLYCVIAFGVVAYGVFQGKEILQFDELQATRIYEASQAHPAWFDFFRGVTDFGGGRALRLLVLGICLLLALRRQYRVALCFAAAAILNDELNKILKETFTRLRPIYVEESIRQTAWSFPSGHAQNSMFLYGFAIYFSFLTYPRWKLCIGISLMTLIILIGLSRMVLGVHYFTDVLCGFLIGMAHLSIWMALLEYYRNRDPVTVPGV